MDADVGLLSMNSACVATFGQGARMCFTTDFIGQTIPLGITGEGWIQPVLLTVVNTGGSTFEALDVATSMSCSGKV